MKKIISVGILALLLVFYSCKKEAVLPKQELTSSSDESISKTVSKNKVVYAVQHCFMLEDGKPGIKCSVNTSVSDCSMPIDCFSIDRLASTKKLLQARFSNQELSSKSFNGGVIKDTEILEALKKDGFPIIENK